MSGGASQYDQLDPGDLEWVTGYLRAEQMDRQLTEFIAGLDKHLHKAQVDPNRPNMQALVAYVRSWLVSLKLAADPEWQGQVADSERRAQQGDLGEPMDAAHLRESLSL